MVSEARDYHLLFKSVMKKVLGAFLMQQQTSCPKGDVLHTICRYLSSTSGVHSVHNLVVPQITVNAFVKWTDLS